MQDHSDYVDLTLDQVPLYLREGEYFKALSEGDDGHAITVPVNALKANTDINSGCDLRNLLTSLQYWIACDDKMMLLITQYILSTDLDFEVSDLKRFETIFPFLRILRVLMT